MIEAMRFKDDQMTVARKRRVKVNAMSFGKLVEAMIDGTYNCHGLAEVTGLHYNTVTQYAREMHIAGACHIASWDKDSLGRDTIKVYKIGRGRDAKRQKMTQAERASRYRAKLRSIELLHRMAA